VSVAVYGGDCWYVDVADIGAVVYVGIVVGGGGYCGVVVVIVVGSIHNVVVR